MCKTTDTKGNHNSGYTYGGGFFTQFVSNFHKSILSRTNERQDFLRFKIRDS